MLRRLLGPLSASRACGASSAPGGAGFRFKGIVVRHRRREGPPFCRTGGRRSRRRPASVRERGTSMCRSTPSAAEQRPSARSGQRFDLPAAWRHTQLPGVILLSRKTEDGRRKTEDGRRKTEDHGRLDGSMARRLDGGSTASRVSASPIEAMTFMFAKDAVPWGYVPSGTWMCHGPS